MKINVPDLLRVEISAREALPELLAGKVDYVLVDRLNYHYADWVYRKYGLEDMRSDEFFRRMGRELASRFEKLNIPCNITFYNLDEIARQQQRTHFLLLWINHTRYSKQAHKRHT